MEELRYLKSNYKIRTVSIFDETFTLDKKRVLRLCDSLISEGLDIRWYCNTRAHLVDLDLLKRMRQAGGRGISYGIESGSQSILDHADKCVTVDQARNAIAWARQARIKTFASFILGLPGETWDTVHETIDFVPSSWALDQMRYRGEYVRFPAHTPDDAPPGASVPEAARHLQGMPCVLGVCSSALTRDLP